jgi:hypothetical protein
MPSAHPITDHDQIREWAEQRGAHPACVKGTGAKNDTGMIRLDFPGYTGKGSLQTISWNAWFKQFDENNLALLVQDTTSRGQQSNFNKLVSRGPTNGRGGRSSRRRSTRRASGRKSSRSRSASGSRSSSSSRSTSSRTSRRTASSRSASSRKTSGSRSRSRKTARPGGRKQTSRGRTRQR